MAGILYLVATPIGNLGDFTPRAVETLENADFIAAEDTRVSMKLLNHFGVKKPLISYHEHNHVTAGQSVLNRLLAGESCALMTDAGTPAISDPGEDLVAKCAAADVPVVSVPGRARKTAWRSGPFPAAAPPSTPWLSAVCPPDASPLKGSSLSIKKAAGST